MGHRVVAMIDQHPEVQKISKEIDDCEAHFDQRKNFLKKQVEDLRDAHEAALKPIRDRLHSYVKTLGAMPKDFKEETHKIQIDDKLGVVFICDCADAHGNNMGRFLEMLGFKRD